MRTTLLSAVLLATLAASSAEARVPAAVANAHALPPHYSLAGTSRCLVRHKAKVGAVVPSDRRLRALRDLAQRNSIQAVFDTGRVGLAFSRSESQAKLLVELLTVPKDPYVLVRRANVVLMYKPAQKRAFTTTVACLRT